MELHRSGRGMALAGVVASIVILKVAGCSDSAAPAADLSPVHRSDFGTVDFAWPDAGVGDLGLGDMVTSPADAATDDAGALEGGAWSDGGPDAPVSWPLPPATYDCTSVATGPPARTSKVPLNCIIDPSCTTTLVTAHRGAGADSLEVLSVYIPLGTVAPENTLSAVRYAIVGGADVVEVDVRSTADGELVLMHDGDVARTTFGQGKVSEMTLAQLQALTLRTGQFSGDFSCERVPTFNELLALVKGRINVDADLKTDATDEVALAVQSAGLIDQVFMSSGSQADLAKARSAVPLVRLQARTDDPSQIPLLQAAFNPPPDIMEIDELILNAGTIALIHAGGAKVFVDAFTYDATGYFTNDPQSYQGIVAKNPDVIQVDRFDLVLQLLGR